MAYDHILEIQLIQISKDQRASGFPLVTSRYVDAKRPIIIATRKGTKSK